LGSNMDAAHSSHFLVPSSCVKRCERVGDSAWYVKAGFLRLALPSNVVGVHGMECKPETSSALLSELRKASECVGPCCRYLTNYAPQALTARQPPHSHLK
jgi:hypothetical protein